MRSHGHTVKPSTLSAVGGKKKPGGSIQGVPGQIPRYKVKGASD